GDRPAAQPSISAIVSFAGASSRSFTTTAAPSRASRNATSRPMPRPEPVTIATLASSCPMSSFSPLSIRRSPRWSARLPAPATHPPGYREGGGAVKRRGGRPPDVQSRLLQQAYLTQDGGVIPVDPLARELVAAKLHDHHDVHRNLPVRRRHVGQEPG